MKKQPFRRMCRRSRQGAVAVEFAITAGLAFLFFFGAFEFSRVAMIRGTIDNAIYEGARVGITPGSTAADVEKKVRDILGFSLVRVANVTVQPNPILFDSKTITVRVDLPLDRNTFSPAQFFNGKSIVRSIQMKREASRFVR
jgi:Flp pilus assembly protein TadG